MFSYDSLNFLKTDLLNYVLGTLQIFVPLDSVIDRYMIFGDLW